MLEWYVSNLHAEDTNGQVSSATMAIRCPGYFYELIGSSSVGSHCPGDGTNTSMCDHEDHIKVSWGTPLKRNRLVSWYVRKPGSDVDSELTPVKRKSEEKRNTRRTNKEHEGSSRTIDGLKMYYV